MKMMEVLALHERYCNEARALSARKSHDYSGHEDALRNFKLCEAIELCSATQGVLVRLTDKLARLVQLSKPDNKPQVTDESIHDTVLDIINYAILYSALLSEGVE